MDSNWRGQVFIFVFIDSQIEFAVATSFDVYGKFAEDILSTERTDALPNLLNQQDVIKLSSLVCPGFNEAIKYHLPKLLLAPIWHAINYFNSFQLLMCLSTSKDDKKELQRVMDLLNALEISLKRKAVELPE